MAVLTQTVTTETAINWEELAQKIKDSTYSQIEYYKDRRNRIKCNKKGGSPDWYWTASVRSGGSARCVSVSGNGHSYFWDAGNELYVPVCFVIQ